MYFFLECNSTHLLSPFLAKSPPKRRGLMYSHGSSSSFFFFAHPLSSLASISICLSHFTASSKDPPPPSPPFCVPRRPTWQKWACWNIFGGGGRGEETQKRHLCIQNTFFCLTFFPPCTVEVVSVCVFLCIT